jgi:hypothetical protein
MLRFFTIAFRTITVVALVGLAIALAPTVGKAFAHSRTTNAETTQNQSVVEQSCTAFEARFLDAACSQVHVRKAAHTKHRLAHK